MRDKIKIFIKLLGLFFLVSLFLSCQQSKNNTADYSEQTEEFEIKPNCKVEFDTIPNNMFSHKIKDGDKTVFVYIRTDNTISNVNEFDAKYSETLIFEIDSLPNEFEYCDTSLLNIHCKYYWICLSKDIKKEIRDIKKGCIKGEFEGDSLSIDIEIDSEYKFGSFLEKSKSRKINFKYSGILSN